MKILISDPFSENGIAILKKEGGFAVDTKTGLSEDDLVSCISEYEGLIVRSGTKVTKKIIEGASSLKVIGRAGVGVDNVDVEAATKRGIIVMNTPGGNTISTAEHAFTMLLALSRRIPQANSSMKAQKWEKKKFKGVEVNGKVLGVIGMGRVGSEVVRFAQAFRMHVLVSDPYISTEKGQKLDVEVVELDEIFKRADYITIHTPLNNETKGMINKTAFDKMKKGVRIINCARGGIVDEKALYDAVTSGKVAGAALDVFEKEPPEGTPLVELDEVIMTPHLGASTTEAQENVAIDVAHQIVDMLKGGTIRNAVNAPSLDAEILSLMQPYISLGEKLGLLLIQLVQAHLETIEIVYSGGVSEYDIAPVTRAILKGMLGHVLQEAVNEVNAPVIAKERGIKVSETKQSITQDFADLITIKIPAGKVEYSIAGTLFGKRQDPRVVRINGYHVDAIPSGYLLVISNEDVPGIIGYVGTVLGNNQVNIAGMTVGRREVGGDAVTVVNVDAPISEELIKEISRNKKIKDIKMVVL